MARFTDKELGMDRPITRRDFLNGMAMVTGAAMMPHAAMAQAAAAKSAAPEAQNDPGYYPPSQTGMRGDHVGSLEVAHAVRDGTFWSKAGAPVVTGESYDLVVVGGGISGLAAAHAFRKAAGPKSKILILENHDDIGGHAKRNEFQVGGKLLLGYGGSTSIMSPLPYSGAAKTLLGELGVVPSDYGKYNDPKVFTSRSMSNKIFFDQETFGADKLSVDPHLYTASMPAAEKEKLWKDFAAQSALPEQGNADVKKLYESTEDFMPGGSSAERKLALSKMSYADFLTNQVKVDPSVIPFMNNRMLDPYGVGADAIPAQDAWALGMPGFAGMKLDPGPGPGMGRNALKPADGDVQYFHFPDGNTTIARLLVRKLIPDAVPGSTAEDVVSAKIGYGLLDKSDNPTRLRLNSTVVRVKHTGEVATAKEVEVQYSAGGKLYSVRGSHCIMACWNAVIPFISTELSPEQKSGLAATDKLPMAYANVALKNWDSFAKVGAASIHAPTSYWTTLALDERVSMGAYQATKDPSEPIIVTLRRFPAQPGLPARSQHRVGRADLYSTNFDTMERNIRDLMARALAGTSFDPAKDIDAITVNRWGHGRTYQYNSLWDTFWTDGSPLPYLAARKPYGRVAVANADSDAYGWADSAINQGFRAVDDLGLTAAGA